jgi:F420-0:gamma-glutamyl ligase
MHELIACMCVVTFKQGGDRRGMIERIESLAVGRDFSESFEQSQFKVHLTSGDVVVVAGSAISAIESTNANRQPNRRKKEPGKKARKARTKNPFTKKRKSIAAKATKAAATVRARKAKRRKAHNG